jgi:hypothetical protein
VESSVPGDAKWAREVTEALSNGGEAEIRTAREIENGLADLAALFPTGGEGIISPADATTIRDALASENFHEQLPALRGAVRATLDKVSTRYAERRTAYSISLKSLLQHLEAKPEWARLESDDREDIATRLTVSALPEKPAHGREVADLRLVLARESNIAGLRAELENELQRRLPPTPARPEPITPPTEEVVNFSDLGPPDVIRTRGDLEVWLSSLRARLDELLRTNKVIRFK